MKITDAYRTLAQVFRDAKLLTPELDARVLMSAVTGIEGLQVAISEKDVTPAQYTEIQSFRARRLQHEPVGRILGKRGFWSFEVDLSPATLEPRPDSETLVEAALDLLGARRHEALRIADLGTGSGVLLIALLLECPRATGLGIDLSKQAIETAQRNAALNNLSMRAQFLCCDWLEAVDEKFDLIVSNPPYIASAACETLPEEVRLYDPRLALDGGVDGLDAYRKIAAQAAAHLNDRGLLAVEIGHDQAVSVGALFAEAGYGMIEQARDLSGHVRVLSFSAHESRKQQQKNRLEKAGNAAKTFSMP